MPLPPWFQGSTTPSFRVRLGSPISSSPSTAILVPSPEHSGQAPNGALNEKVRGSISVSGDRVAVRAAQLLAEGAERRIPLQIDEVDHHQAVGEPERGLDRVGEPGQQIVGCDQPVDDDRDVVLDLLLEHGRFGELDQLTVDEGARVAAGRELFEQVDELALLLRDHRREHLVPGAGLELHQLVGDLLHGLALDRLAADRAVRNADARPEQAHVVVDLGDRADRRARVAVRRLLVDRDGRAQALDEVDIRAVDLPEELARVRRQRLDVAALALGEDRVEGEARLAGARQAREDDQGVARDLEIHVLQVVDPSTSNAQLLGTGHWIGSTL